MELRKGTTLKDGKYRIERVLGSGGFGVTYLAMSKENISGAIGHFDVDVPIAIKEFFLKDGCLRAADGRTVEVTRTEGGKRVETYRSKFIKEAHNMADLNHPHIVHVSDVFEENQTVYYVMEYLKGGSLRDLVKNGGKPLSEDIALTYVRQIAEALQYMHNRNICHLDVKPANIMLNDKGEAMLIDFGISKKYDELGHESTATPLGITSGYAPLEQYQGTIHEFSPQSDIYSLGATLYFLVTGNVPPEAPLVLEKGLGSQLVGLSDHTWQLITKAMQPIRRDRFADMQAFINCIDGNCQSDDNDSDADNVDLDDDEVTVVKDERNPQPVITSSVDPVKSHKTSRNWAKGIAVLVAFAILGALAYWLYGNLATSTVSRYQWVNADGDTLLYSGDLRGGVPHGEGKAEYADGRLYEGKFHKGLRSDRTARFVFDNKSVFVGEFDADTLKHGRVDFPDAGKYYEGNFIANQPSNGYWYDTKSGKKTFKVTNGHVEEI